MSKIDNFEKFNENLSNDDSIKIGDIVGNTIQGFNFEVIDMENKLHGLKVKDIRNGEVFNTTYENMRKRGSKNKRFNESDSLNTSDVSDSKNEHELINMIESIISSEIYLRDVPFSMQDGDMEPDPTSITDAAKLIVNMLKERGLI